MGKQFNLKISQKNITLMKKNKINIDSKSVNILISLGAGLRLQEINSNNKGILFEIKKARLEKEIINLLDGVIK